MKTIFAAARRAVLGALLFIAAISPSLAQFPDQQSWASLSGGTANAITLSIANYDSDLAGVELRFLAALPNTAATTVSINGRSPIPLYHQTNTGIEQLTGGEIAAGQVYSIIWDGGQYQIVGAATTQVPISVTSALTVTTALCNHDVILQGTFYAVTVGAATGFPTDCVIKFINSRSPGGNNRGKGISLDGYSSFRLMPTMPLTIRVAGIGTSGNGHGWIVDQGTPSALGNSTAPSQLWVSSPTFYFNPASGSDDPLLADCLDIGSSACATPQVANNIAKQYVFVQTGGGLTVQADCNGSPFTAGVLWTGHHANTHIPTLLGNPSNPSACQWLPPSGITVDVQDYGAVTVSGFLFGNPNNTSACALNSRQFAIMDIRDLIFGSNVNGFNVCLDELATVNTTNPLTLNGNSARTFTLSHGSVLYSNGQTINIPASSGSNVGIFMVVDTNAVWVGGFNFVVGGGAALSGQQWVCSLGGVMTGALGTNWGVTSLTTRTPTTSGLGCLFN